MKNTSKKSYVKSLAFKENHKSKILQAFKVEPVMDVTRISTFSGLTQVQAHKRLSELERELKITPVDQSKQYTTYRLVKEGERLKAQSNLTIKTLKNGCRMLLNHRDRLSDCLIIHLEEFNNSLKK